MPKDCVSLLVVLSVVASAPSLPAAPVPRPSPEQVRKELDALWVDLRSENELTAGRALLKFAARPDDSVKYFNEKMQPLRLSKKRAMQWIADLGSGDKYVAREAFEALTYFDPRLALEDKELQKALVTPPAMLGDHNPRLAAVLCDLPMDTFCVEYWHFHSPDGKVYRFNNEKEVRDLDVAIKVEGIGIQGRKSSWARAARAIAILEHIRTPAAMEILEDMATGHPDAAPTKAAKVALQRMKRR